MMMETAVRRHPLLGPVYAAAEAATAENFEEFRWKIERVAWPGHYVHRDILEPSRYIPASFGILNATGTGGAIRAEGVIDGTAVSLVSVSDDARLLAEPLRILSLIIPCLNAVMGRNPMLEGFLVHGDEDKVLPSVAGKPVGTDHVNSGLSIRRGVQGHVFLVYRREDMLKVIIHEVLHCYGLDRRSPSPAFERWLAERWGVRSEPDGGVLRLTEAYVDALAILMYCIVTAKPWSARKVSRLIGAASKHCMAVAGNLVRHFTAAAGRRGIIAESTHAFSYYVAKAALLFDVARGLAAMPQSGLRTAKDVLAFQDAVANALASGSFVAALEGQVRRRPSSRKSGKSLRMVP